MAGGDTLSANIDETSQEIIQTTQALMPQESPMLNLVTRITLKKGEKEAELPFVNSTSSVTDLTEGDEVVVTSQFDLSSVTRTTDLRAIMVRVSHRAERFSRDALVAMISKEMSQTQAEHIDGLLVALFASGGLTAGSSGADLSLATLRTCRRALKENTRANGGPAPAPIYCVVSPQVEEHLLTDLGLQGVVGSTAPWIPPGLSAEIMKSYAIPGGNLLGGIGIFWDGNMSEDGSGDYICGVFSKRALYYITSAEWDVDIFKESNWPGVIVRALADYGVGIGPYSKWIVKLTADGA